MQFLLIGFGNIGVRHAAILAEHNLLAGIVDSDVQKLVVAKEKYPSCSCYSQIQQALDTKNFDVAVICTPNAAHTPQAVSCLQAGLHVVVEKPMAITFTDAQLLQQTAVLYQRKLFVVKQNRFNPPVIAVKTAIQDGVLGSLIGLQVNGFWNRNSQYYQGSTWRGTKQQDGGMLLTQFSHFIDVALWLVGNITPTAASITNQLHDGLEIEDACVLTCKGNNGLLGTMHFTTNAYEQNMEGSITILGTLGTVKIGGAYLNKIAYQNIENHSLPAVHTIGLQPNTYNGYQGSMSNHPTWYKQLLNEWEDPSEIFSVNDAVQTIDFIEQVYKMAKPL